MVGSLQRVVAGHYTKLDTLPLSYILLVVHSTHITYMYHACLLFKFIAEGTAGSDFFPEGLTLYPGCPLSIDYFE